VAGYHDWANAHHLNRHYLLSDVRFENISQAYDSDCFPISRKPHGCGCGSGYLLNDFVVVGRNRLDNFLDCVGSALDDLCLVGSNRDATFNVGFEFSSEPSPFTAYPTALRKHEAGSSGQFDAARSGASAELVDL